MDKYLTLMQEIIVMLDGTYLTKIDHPAYQNRKPILGATIEQIQEAETIIEKTIPPSMKAWYLVAGENAPCICEYDMDFSLKDLINSQEVADDQHNFNIFLNTDAGAEELQKYGEDGFRLTSTIIPFSSRLGDELHYANLQNNKKDDPPVFVCWQGCNQESIAFSAFIREKYLRYLDSPYSHNEYVRQTLLLPNEKRIARKALFDSFRERTKKFRGDLIIEVHQYDLENNTLTNPINFQKIWMEKFPKTDIWKDIEKEGLRMPFGWVERPTGIVNPKDVEDYKRE